MRAIILAAATLAALSGAASAQTTIIERDEPAVIVRDRPAAVIERREIERDRPPIGGCESKTVTRTDADGETTTVRKERCD
ncbi:hypothetical protein [Methylobacterium haplocladii]|uniref:Uncharacterized protein n=1 Tax=Methylobacterium haplocladii TaxID=1176176 RepID=A0A512IPX1_9HYPH|nr:hypothetical protein [Methylobacterium haplocladii]GEO99739.1 hypothetical protein MHA02_21270 [Methylobacterium haplocladii]GJD84628.1 hypothetical protein HPGCJGGD_2508 [Methylobacterium haplocladii]GLS61096.1 hypothetical protein GCM10007887_37900 [Methylobacterium haplocladii]